MAAWMDVAELPPAENGATRIPPPMQEISDALNRLHEQQNFTGLLESAESRVGQFLFWLDLSRYAAEALEQLGYQEAHQALADETARYVARLPGIERLAFSDGTPFADPDTAAWIKDIRAENPGRAVPSGPNGDEGAGETETSAAEGRFARARTLAKGKKLPEAVTLLQGFINGAGSEKGKLIGRMRLVRLLVEVKKPRLALPHVAQIIASLDRYGLETWEPALALEALVQVYSVLKNQKDDGLNAQSAEVFDRIARLNPATALQLDG
jgi:type VI secretion system protein VasJ